MWVGIRVAVVSLLIVKVACLSHLYEDSDVITVLTTENFTNFVNSQPTLVQFYRSNCGGCINYSPVFKNITKSVENWKWAIKFAVVNCFDPANRDLVHKYDVVTVPKFLLFYNGAEPESFPVYYSADTFRDSVSEILINRKLTEQLIPGSSIPDAFTVYGPDIKKVAMVVLDTQSLIDKKLRSEIVDGAQFGIKDLSNNVLFSSENPDAVRDFIVKNHGNPAEKPSKIVVEVESNNSQVVNPIAYSMPVYAADIISSLRELLTDDIALKKEITGTDLDALKEFLAVLSKYLDIGRQYNEEIVYLQNSVSEKSKISREEWLDLLKKMKLSTDDTQHIACRGSQPGLRGYPCGLWIMFHAMTVSRYLKNENSAVTAPIAHALNRFVPRFFSCSYCAYHFAKMTSNVRYPGEAVYPDRTEKATPFPLVEPDPSTLPTPPKSARDEVLWLNKAHNIVNKRLSGYKSDDPAAPKAMFPSPQQCRFCWSDEAKASLEKDKFAAFPDKTEELFSYLVHHYRPSSWRWDNVCVSFEDISQSNLRGGLFDTGDIILASVISICCSAALVTLFAFVCCRWRCKKRGSVPIVMA